ncbi:hypothetical protein [Vagococcus intermedius]|uniref:YcaO domain-containing protein n=1 Tax=Vagococcus intermedius TaxID=2991418 RepID=A0AAF0CW23_9ENTE|nr:hypothetical protein [Vagococcus intermedius]WEG74034.1 hypothetical protein OL234_03815 [Vagococcus intermedius]WEG76114.1 hypothetical protein OL235_03820 [Vagococcus intermedius]
MDIEKLSSDKIGLMKNIIEIPNVLGEPKYRIFSSMLGDISQINLLKDHNFGKPMVLGGAGGDKNAEMAVLKASVETLERYCNCFYTEYYLK